MRALLATGLLTLLPPLSAAAATEATFDFRGTTPAGVEIEGWTGVTPAPQGLDIRTSADGALFLTVDPEVEYQALRVKTLAPKATDALVLWFDETGEMIQMPFIVLGGDDAKETVVTLSRHSDFSKSAKFGVAFPSNTTVTVQDITLVHYSLPERLWTSVRSTLKADVFQTFSINFLWGPLSTGIADEIPTLFKKQPPVAMSAMRIVYGILAVAAVVAFVRRKKGWRIVAGTTLALWLFLDLRMSAELLSYAANDWKTYLTKPVEERVLRDRLDYYRTIEQSAPWLKETDRFGVLTTWPVMGSIRYFTYPASPVQVTTLADGQSLRRWLVFSAPDAEVRDGVLYWKNEPVSARGRVVRTFSDTSFLFETE